MRSILAPSFTSSPRKVSQARPRVFFFAGNPLAVFAISLKSAPCILFGGARFAHSLDVRQRAHLLTSQRSPQFLVEAAQLQNRGNFHVFPSAI